MLVKSFGEDERRKMTKSDFFGSPFLSSHVLNGTFASIFMNCYTDCNHAGINILDQLYLSEESPVSIRIFRVATRRYRHQF